jgi:IS30 family transposase
MTRSTGRRRRLSAAARQRVWQEWQAGVSLEAISAALAVSPSGVYSEITAHGGIAPAAPRRSPRALSLGERRLLAQWQVGPRAGVGVREAARRLGRAPSTISREIRRHGQRTATTRRYDAETADRRAWARARRPKPCLLARRPVLRALVAAQLAADWSPTGRRRRSVRGSA